jgi:hypothetical protein
MEAVITRVILNAGAESARAAAMRRTHGRRRTSQGWIAGSILTPVDDRDARLIVGLWEPAPRGSNGITIPRSATPPND